MTSSNYDDEFATRVIAAIETRIARKLQSGAQIQYTWGSVQAVAADGKSASLFLRGETDPAYVSGDFRIPDTMVLSVSDIVKAAIDYGTGDRWIEEVSVSTAYKKLTIGQDGVILFGSGAALSDTNLYRYAASRLATDDDLIISLVSGNGLSIGTTAAAPAYGIAFGADTNLYRYAVNTLATDDQFLVMSASGVVVVQATGSVIRGFDQNTDTQPFFNFSWDGTYAGFSLGAGGTTAVDTNLYRSAANTLKTDDSLIVLGSIQQGPDSSDSIKLGSGTIELFSANPLIDFKNAAVDDYDARIIYNLSSSGKLAFYGAPVAFNVARIETLTAFMSGGGTSFPASPTTNDRYWRTDLDMEFFYDGARWLSTTLFSQPLYFRAAEAQAATTPDAYRGGVSYLTAAGIYIEDWTCTWYTSSGTINGSNYWVDTLFLHGINGGAASATLGTNTCNSGAIAQFHRNQIAINAVVDLDSYTLYTVTATLVGTNGSHYLWSVVTYRHIAT